MSIALRSSICKCTPKTWENSLADTDICCISYSYIEPKYWGIIFQLMWASPIIYPIIFIKNKNKNNRDKPLHMSWTTFLFQWEIGYISTGKKTVFVKPFHVLFKLLCKGFYETQLQNQNGLLGHSLGVYTVDWKPMPYVILYFQKMTSRRFGLREYLDSCVLSIGTTVKTLTH